MSQEVSLSAQVRTQTGKGGSRRVRREGMIPGIVYKNKSEPIAVKVLPMPFKKAVMGPWRRNALIRLDIEGKGVRPVMVKELQKHPVRRHALHIDFVEVDEKVPVEVKVPFTTTGRSQAEILGGKVHTPRRYLRIRCLPTQIPEKIVLDKSDLDWGAHRASVVKLPEGAALIDDEKLTVLTIARPRGVAAEETPAADAAAEA